MCSADNGDMSYYKSVICANLFPIEEERKKKMIKNDDGAHYIKYQEKL